ncbi:MAG: 30S ribosomal protein S12 methylthiotransferase RimO [Eggerthellaceae bacterium]|nr:30S ribosomal protein S12 methylthiotransferase RimO [Eggerthellaceae bacterium]
MERAGNVSARAVDPLRVFFSTMGCAKNEVDSSRMATLLTEVGCRIVDDPDSAECLIVNTCSFIQAATEESIVAVLELCGLPHVEKGDAKVIVAGCMPSRYGDDLAESLTEADQFVPCSSEDDIASIVDRLFPGRLGSTQLSLPLGEVSSYVKISEGCDRFCTFCTIPFIRGRYHSYSFGRIDSDVRTAIASGAREIVLIGQDTGRWGNDLREKGTLAQLLDRLATSYADTWFRVMYVQPEGVSDELIEVIASHDNVASYLDIPFQHSSPRILSAMNRRGSREMFLSLIERIRSRVPGVALRTTLSAGFPGETEEEFSELCAFVEDAELDYVGVFAYSREDGTRAARLPDQLDDEEKQRRAMVLRDVADALSSMVVSRHVGEDLTVLVEGVEEDGQRFGRAQCQAPDVDGVVYVPSGEVGSFEHVTIVDTLGYDMEGE